MAWVFECLVDFVFKVKLLNLLSENDLDGKHNAIAMNLFGSDEF